MNLIKAFYVIFDKDKQMDVIGPAVVINLDHVVRFGESFRGNVKKQEGLGVCYTVDTINDHSGYGLHVTSLALDKLMENL